MATVSGHNVSSRRRVSSRRQRRRDGRIRTADVGLKAKRLVWPDDRRVLYDIAFSPPSPIPATAVIPYQIEIEPSRSTREIPNKISV